MTRQPRSTLADARWVSVAGVCPAAGTSTVSALLSQFYASFQRYRIVAVDVHPDDGPLGTTSPAGFAEVAATSGSFAELASCLGRSAQGPWVLTGGTRSPTESAECQGALDILSRFFAVGVVDCGTIGAAISEALLERADAALLVAPATIDGVLAAARALDSLATRRPATADWHAGIALVPTVPQLGHDARLAARLLSERGARVFRFPNDAALACGQVNLASVSDGVRAATGRLGADMLSHAAAGRGSAERR